LVKIVIYEVQCFIQSTAVEDSGCNSVIPKFTDDSSKLKGNKEIGKLSIVFQSNAEICDVVGSNASYRVSSEL